MLVESFGEGFGQTIRECLENDRAVVVMLTLEALDMLVDTDARRHRKCANVVCNLSLARRDEIGKAVLRCNLVKVASAGAVKYSRKMKNSDQATD